MRDVSILIERLAKECANDLERFQDTIKLARESLNKATKAMDGESLLLNRDNPPGLRAFLEAHTDRLREISKQLFDIL